MSFQTKNEPVFNFIRNSTLICKDCKYKIDGVVRECNVYERKPAVIFSSGACPYYEKEQKD